MLFFPRSHLPYEITIYGNGEFAVTVKIALQNSLIQLTVR